MLNADHGALGPADESQMGRPPPPSASLGKPVARFPDATSAICAKLTIDMSHQHWRDWVSPDTDYIKICLDLPSRPD